MRSGCVDCVVWVLAVVPMVMVVVAMVVAVVYWSEYVLYCGGYIILLGCLSILLFNKFFPFCIFIFFLFKNSLTPLCLCRDKTKRQSNKNTILTQSKTLPSKK